MPTYGFACDTCEIQQELKMTFEQHSNTKDSIRCEKCGKVMYQVVAPLRFTLKGCGWFAAADTSGGNSAGTGYEVTQRSLNDNLEEEKRIEDRFNTAQAKGMDFDN